MAKKSKKPQPPPSSGGVVSLAKSNWQDPLSTRIVLSNDATGALQFTFPPQGNSVNYLITNSSSVKAPVGKIQVTFEAVASANAVFSYQTETFNTCPGEPDWRILVMAHGTNWSDPDARWWSNPLKGILANGAVTVAVPVTPDQWSNVDGQFGSTRVSQFTAAFHDVSHYGLTFGGGCFFGHGVFMQAGTAVGKLHDYRIIS